MNVDGVSKSKECGVANEEKGKVKKEVIKTSKERNAFSTNALAGAFLFERCHRNRFSTSYPSTTRLLDWAKTPIGKETCNGKVV